MSQQSWDLFKTSRLDGWLSLTSRWECIKRWKKIIKKRFMKFSAELGAMSSAQQIHAPSSPRTASLPAKPFTVLSTHFQLHNPDPIQNELVVAPTIPRPNRSSLPLFLTCYSEKAAVCSGVGKETPLPLQWHLQHRPPPQMDITCSDNKEARETLHFPLHSFRAFYDALWWWEMILS